jgi:sarcosine oxidase subunit delta
VEGPDFEFIWQDETKGSAMRITCPICGERDRREFYYKGAAVALNRPEPVADLALWDDYLHLRDNPAGETRELWYHESGCSAWLVVTRNTVTHEVLGAELASAVAGANT